MNYQQAAASYRDDPSPDNLDRLTMALCAAMSLRERAKLLHGDYLSFVARVIYGAVCHGSIFYLPFTGGGCRRLGVPRYAFSDGPRGAVTGHGTCFPVTMMRAASFDPEMEYRVGTAMAKEAAAAGANFFAGVCINLVRNPRGGRSQESCGEDPFLLGRMGAALVKAVQAEGVIACPKHFALNSIENLRFLVSANCDERALREIYLYHFRQCVAAGALSMMGAYNRVNGSYCCENRQLLQEILREEWGFDGFTMSDFVWGVHDAARSLKVGLDSEMSMPRIYNFGNIKRLIRKRELAEADVSRAARNILGVLIRQAPKLRPQPKAVMKCREHLELAEDAAVKGMVLLKNENDLLPLPLTAKIAVLGPYADSVNVGDKGSSMVLCRDGVTPYAGLRRIFTGAACYSGVDAQQALHSAAAADTVIVCVGCDYRDEGEFLLNAGNRLKKKPAFAAGGDRGSLDLNPSHLDLLKALKRAGKKVIAVLYTGSVILTGNFEAYADAIIMGYYGGIRFGSALASLLSGEKNFSGKLPVSIAQQAGDYPPFREIGQKPYEVEYGYYNGYYLFEKDGIQPAYPFGFGLSFANFRISDVKAARNAQGGISVTAAVRNEGPVSGAEVVQVYAGSAGAAEHRPVKMLRGFQRLELLPGSSGFVEINIAADDLKFYDSGKKAWVLDPAYFVYVGNSSADAGRQPGLKISMEG